MAEKTIEETLKEQIDQLSEQLSTMVNPEEYSKLKLEYDKLLADYVSKRSAKQPEPTQTRSAKEIANDIRKAHDGNMTNRDYIKLSLEYREAHLKEFGTDPFTDFGTNGPGKSSDDSLEVAEALQTMLDENESPVDFRIKMNQALDDDPQLLMKLKKARARA